MVNEIAMFFDGLFGGALLPDMLKRPIYRRYAFTFLFISLSVTLITTSNGLEIISKFTKWGREAYLVCFGLGYLLICFYWWLSGIIVNPRRKALLKKN